MSSFSLDDLAAIVGARASAHAEKSYTRSLLDKGPLAAAKKFGEEAVELAIAASAQDEAAVRAEAADVLYHLLVVLHARKVRLADVMAELEKRTGRSGHEEKASRT
jgi:phosphoribosyl-ATP pyrophosphohydrolase